MLNLYEACFSILYILVWLSTLSHLQIRQKIPFLKLLIFFFFLKSTKQKTLNPIRQRSESWQFRDPPPGWHLSANKFNLVTYHSQMPFCLLHKNISRNFMCRDLSKWSDHIHKQHSYHHFLKDTSQSCKRGSLGWDRLCLPKKVTIPEKQHKHPLFSHFTCSLIHDTIFMEMG